MKNLMISAAILIGSLSSLSADSTVGNLIDTLSETGEQAVSMTPDSLRRSACPRLGKVSVFSELLAAELTNLDFPRKFLAKRITRKASNLKEDLDYGKVLCTEKRRAWNVVFATDTKRAARRIKWGLKDLDKLTKLLIKKKISLEAPIAQATVRGLIMQIESIVTALPLPHSCEGDRCLLPGWQTPICYQIGKVQGLRDVLMKVKGDTFIPAINEFNATLDGELELETCKHGRWAHKYRREVANLKKSLHQMVDTVR